MISQRPSDGFVNLSQMAEACGKKVNDYFRQSSTYEYLSALSGSEIKDGDSRKSLTPTVSATDFAKAFPDLVQSRRGSMANGGGTWGHLDVAMDVAQWCSIPMRVWANRTLVQIVTGKPVDRQSILNRMLDTPNPGSPIFEAEFEMQIARVTGYHKNDIRNSQFYWEFVYFWLTPDERVHLNEINPVIKATRRRKYKIHDCLQPETKIRLAPMQLKMLGKLESCNSLLELRRMFSRVTDGIDQKSLFDGWDDLLEGSSDAS